MITINNIDSEYFITYLIDGIITAIPKIQRIFDNRKRRAYKIEILKSIKYFEYNVENHRNDHKDIINPLLIKWSNIICLINTRQLLSLFNINKQIDMDTQDMDTQDIDTQDIDTQINDLKDLILTSIVLYIKSISANNNYVLNTISNEINDIIYILLNSYIKNSHVSILNNLYKYIVILYNHSQVNNNNNVVIFINKLLQIKYKDKYLNTQLKITHLIHLNREYRHMLKYIIDGNISLFIINLNLRIRNFNDLKSGSNTVQNVVRNITDNNAFGTRRINKDGRQTTKNTPSKVEHLQPSQEDEESSLSYLALVAEKEEPLSPAGVLTDLPKNVTSGLPHPAETASAPNGNEPNKYFYNFRRREEEREPPRKNAVSGVKRVPAPPRRITRNPPAPRIITRNTPLLSQNQVQQNPIKPLSRKNQAEQKHLSRLMEVQKKKISRKKGPL